MFQSEAKCEAIDMTMVFLSRENELHSLLFFILIQIKLIFTRKVLQ